MRSIEFLTAIYESPVVTMHKVCIEQGFNLSSGSDIEHIGGREEEVEW